MNRLLSLSLMLTLIFAMACDEKPAATDTDTEEPVAQTEPEAPASQSAPAAESDTPGLDESEQAEVRDVLQAEAAEQITADNAEAQADALAAELAKELEELQ